MWSVHVSPRIKHHRVTERAGLGRTPRWDWNSHTSQVRFFIEGDFQKEGGVVRKGVWSGRGDVSIHHCDVTVVMIVILRCH